MGLEAETINRAYTKEELQIIGKRYELIKRYSKDKTLLDVGCGSGLGLNYLLNQNIKKIYAIDIDKENILESKKNISKKNANKIDFECCDFLKFKHKRKYDVISAMQVLQYIKLDKFLKNAKKRLNSNGTIIVEIPNAFREDGFKKSDLGKYYYNPIDLKKEYNNLEIYGVFLIKKETIFTIFKNKARKIFKTFNLSNKTLNILRTKFLNKEILKDKLSSLFFKKYEISKIKLEPLTEKNYRYYKIIYLIWKY
ncbi:MAG TPA: class I SAM-dependent methyltransferase [archaeon]|nr:class I SAM-dependent methyltransferase [archaeon]